MRRKSARISARKSVDTSQELVDAAKRRLFEAQDENAADKFDRISPERKDDTKLFKEDDRSVSLTGISISALCLTVFLLSYCLPYWFWTYLEAEITEEDGQLYIHLKNNQRIYIIGFVTSTVVSSACAFLCCCTSWTVTFFDSLEPGRHPPTPMSPSKYRRQSGHTFHTSYATSLLNSLAVALYVLWWRRTDYLIL